MNTKRGTRMRRYPLDKQKQMVANFIAAIPEIRPSYDEHIADNDELLPYDYLPNAIRALSQLAQGGQLNDDVYDRLADLMESTLRSEPDAIDLIALGVLEELRDSSLWQRIKDRLGPRTLHALEDEP